MNSSDETCAVSNQSLIFTVRIAGKTYRCPVSQEALYELCKSQDPVRSRIDSYLELKAKIRNAMERLVQDGAAIPPPILEPKHFSQ